MKKFKFYAGWILTAVSVLMLIKSIALCFCNDIWYDELFTVGMAEHSYGEMAHFTARDVHPPLYYCIVKLVADLCKLIVPAAGTIIPAKLVSVIPCFILPAYGVTFLRKRFGIFVGGMFSFCSVAMPRLSEYTVEIRMYSWALLFVTAALLHAYGMLTANEKKWRSIHGTGLLLYGLAAAYTQYFACVAVIVIYLSVLIVFLRRDRKRVKEWLLWVGISVLCYLPWLFSLAGQISAVSDNYWILPLTWKSLGGCVKFLLKPAFTNEVMNNVFAVALFVIYIGLFAHFLKKVYYNGRVYAEHFWFACTGLGALCGLVFFGFAASLLVRPIFVYRYMVSAMGGFWLCFAICLDELCKPESDENRAPDLNGNGGRIRRWVIRLQIAVTAFVFVIGLRNYRAFMGEEEYKALLMKDTEAALTSIAPDDILIYNFDQVQAVTSYYIAKETDSYLWGGSPEELIQDIIRPYGTVENTDEIAGLLETAKERGAKVWFIGSFNSRQEIVALWEEKGFNVTETGSYLLERYWFNLYEVNN